jgi:PPOX class probable F420-dependent enzyme
MELSTALSAPAETLLGSDAVAHVWTENRNGSPQVSVVWIKRDGDLLRFSTAEGRVKARNLRDDPRVHLSFTPVDDPYRNITIRGNVTELTTDGTWLIDELAEKYTGRFPYPWGQPGEVRLNVVVEPTSISG